MKRVCLKEAYTIWMSWNQLEVLIEVALNAYLPLLRCGVVALFHFFKFIGRRPSTKVISQ
ncbi:hypothetical protein CA54_05510 [Symmachiella macrocystis]|uniref:Uncharacterized protein n=1 Tax=Symmachiella macrocystis TaxID=2527985 RepID=A0A5C6BJ56_9PLAN|nr:hypothetical protein [Symmachiella macrocystis]TWU11742.1 hypothetical protein CA54_05510 [Symmachiella macrocystis]